MPLKKTLESKYEVLRHKETSDTEGCLQKSVV